MKSIRALLFAFCFLLFACSGEEKASEENTEANPLIDPPIPEVEVPEQEYQVKADEDTTLRFERTGTEVHLPAGSFVNDKGEKVKGEVDVSYKEYHTAADIYAAGIPTTYSSETGGRRVFESYGMMELRASKDGESLSKADDKEVRVEMRSIRKGNADLFYLNEASGEWEKYGQDSVERTSKEAEREELPPAPMPPTVASENAIRLRKGIEIKAPERYDRLRNLFEPVNPGQCDPPSKTERVTIGYANIPGTYKVSFSHPRLEKVVATSCLCRPAFENKGERFKKAMKAYKEKYAEQLERSERLREAFEERWNRYEDLMVDNLSMGGEDTSEVMDQVMNGPGYASAREKMTRSFEVQGFGVTNCDRLQKVPSSAELIASYSDREGRSLKLRDVAVAELESNSLMRIEKKVRFDPEKKNLLWGITQEGNLAYMKPKALASIEQRDGSYTFEMKVHPESIDSYEAIKDLLF